MQNSLSFDRSHLTLHPFVKNPNFHFLSHHFQKSNSGSKNENFILKSNHIVWPIKWKGILHRLTIWSQKICQYNSVESSLKMGPISFYFEDYSKSARWMILFWLVPCYHTPTLHKNAEKPTVIWFFTHIFITSTVQRWHTILMFHGNFGIISKKAQLTSIHDLCSLPRTSE